MRKVVLCLRRLVALGIFIAFVLLFAGVWVKPLGALAKGQFVPALLAGSLVTAGVLVAMTLLFGRVYCSVCCPLGILQDIAFRFRKHRRQGGSSRAQTCVRYAVLAVFLAAGFAGFGFAWIEPYGLFGRLATLSLAGIACGVVIFALAVWKGRVWCNWVCPVGTFLGGLARHAPFSLRIDAATCIGCRQCERACRASAIAISGQGGTIDATKCVQCRDCTVTCPKGAIGERAPHRAPEPDGTPKTEGITRRTFLVGSGATAAALAAQAADEKIFDGDFAEVTEPGIDVRNASLKPAGAHAIKAFAAKCVGCQLCVKACPNKVLRPSLRLKDFMQPEMAFDQGYCTIDCNRCGQVCPAGAIEPIPDGMKQHIHIGEALWHPDRCLAATEGVNCSACYRHCPVQAILRVAGPDGTLVPVVDADTCIGCGACEHVCPARPLPGMTVKAYERHREVWPTREEAALLEARQLLKEGFSCVLVKNGVIVAKEQGGGVMPLLTMLDEHAGELCGAWVVDKVVGRAAAAICIVGKAAKVYGQIVSDDAAALLAQHAVPCEALVRVPKILNRDRTGSCPLEAACASLDNPDDMVAALRAR